MRIAHDKAEQKVLDDIAKFGWHFVSVMEDETHPPHGFTVGLFETFNHPEVLIIGLDAKLMHSMANEIARNLKAGQSISPGDNYPGLITDFDCVLVNVDKAHYQSHVGFARWYYEGNNFPLVQCVWPSNEGLFPWQEGAPSNFVSWQSVLGNHEQSA
ncbi:DUF4262 domain-containing protein [Oxalicibacterium solurbis]|uniref:DUF4262 domain-containing protein n=1 Tax=Oxalicibacterium solurbis TaxID=69280 RepID=A0A8J3AWR5_9BURK|nr:DUF4262 domain-containing protein [Oxalicibacterium solurbis]GGI53576.1 hypothetical protein GCM10011430_07500 [Oxalicibacterium solurbis]